MNVASKELCQELYEVSGWNGPEKTWLYHEPMSVDANRGATDRYILKNSNIANWNKDISTPAYDLGYLLRKLPPIVTIKSRAGGRWSAQLLRGQLVYSHQERKDEVKKREIERSADTPEDAACKLAIELFKQGVLTK